MKNLTFTVSRDYNGNYDAKLKLPEHTDTFYFYQSGSKLRFELPLIRDYHFLDNTASQIFKLSEKLLALRIDNDLKNVISLVTVLKLRGYEISYRFRDRDQDQADFTEFKTKEDCLLFLLQS
jgi:hypothetical protein